MRQALNWIKDQPVWLYTVIKTWGASPRAVGSPLIANGDGVVCACGAGARQ
ncbi:XdhC family protein [Erwinia sp. 198]|uniref:XdhC family protein n=1 Tax=Erwinia sp. 198 TaxID=2022746 RepID=UPI001F254FD9|nr:XdhC family protein [Erwinia sp. 198]